MLRKRSIRFRAVYPHPVADVWEALTNKEAMSEWLMPCDIEPVVGHQFRFRTKSYPGFDGTVHCEVLEVVPERKLSFSWSGGTLSRTVVTFNLTPLGETTQLDFCHDGFEGLLNQLIVSRILAQGWLHKILPLQLPNYLKNERRF